MRNLLPVLLLLVPGCSTIVSGTTQSLTVSTTPSGAACSVDRNGQHLGTVSPTPGSLIISKSVQPLKLTCTKSGYEAAAAEHKSEFAAMTAGNLIFGGGIGIIVDAASGASSIYPAEAKLVLNPGQQPNALSAVPPSASSPLSTTPSVVASVQSINTEASFNDKLAGRCPARGTKVERSDGRRVIYRGSDPSNPAICLMMMDGNTVARFYGVWPAEEGNTSPAFPVLKRLVEDRPNEELTFLTNDPLSSGASSPHEQIWRYAGQERLKLDEVYYETDKLTVETKQLVGKTVLWRQQIWLDRATGLEVKHTSEQVRGSYIPAQNWNIISIDANNRS